MTSPENDLQRVLAHWFDPRELSGLQVHQIAPGLSGAKLWRVTLGQTSYCLRQWPTSRGTAVRSIKSVHGLIEHVWNNGFRDVPLPKRTLKKGTLVESQGRIWELGKWLDGAGTRHPARQQAVAASDALARFHLAAATYADQLLRIAPGLKHRLEVLEELRTGLLARINTAVRNAVPSATREIAFVILPLVELLLPKAVQSVHLARKQVPLQWCLYDCHILNFLFDGKRVTGLVDFAIASRGSVAQDVARLVGSIPPEDQDKWQDCLAAYQNQRILSGDELFLVYAFHLSGMVARAANWLRWRFAENCEAADAETAHSRLLELAAVLRVLSGREETYSVLFRHDW